MRSIFCLAVSLLFFLGGCSEVEVHACETNRECHPDAVCSEGYCLYDPLPRLLVEASGHRAAIGEVIWLDASSSFMPEGGAIELELVLEPAEVAEELPAAEPLRRGFRIVEPHRNVEATLIGRSETGREARWSQAVAPKNSAPRVRLELPERMQPGETVRIEAHVDDPDGDPFEFEWSYEGVGTFRAEGLEGELSLPEGDEESVHRIEARASDGIDAARAEVSFQAKNAPPRIVEIIDPGTVDHQCGEVYCHAQARFEVVAEDIGPLEYHWRFLGEIEGEAVFEGDDAPESLLILQTFRSRRISGEYGVEVLVRDSSGAVATQTTTFSVGNRPPSLIAHDGETLEHRYFGNGKYQWMRRPESVSLWEDPDGDMPLDVEWSSPDERLYFSHPRSLDTSISILGDESLLGQRIPLEVSARDPNGAEVVAKGEMLLGNRPPELVDFDHSDELVHVPGEGGWKGLDVRIAIEDPDGDPFEYDVAIHPDDPGYRLESRADGVFLKGFFKPDFSVRLVITATDSLGGVMEEIRWVEVEGG